MATSNCLCGSNTRLLYLRDGKTLKASAKIVKVFDTPHQEDAARKYTTIILDRSHFYPQGGGQPSDKGVIRGHDHLFEFQVESVRLMTAPSASSEALQKVVHHTGTFLSSVHLQDEGNLRLPIEVDYEIHKNLRELHNRLHSGGHILDIALFDILGFQDKLSVGKAYHFPEGPSIEYVGAWPMTPVEKQDMRNKLELACEQILATKANVLILFDPNDDREDNDGAMRYMQVEGFDRKIPCGGTHISNLSEISQITIRKIEIRSKILRIGYNVSSE